MNTLEQIREWKIIYNDIKTEVFKLQEYTPQSSDELSKVCLLLTKYQSELINIERKLWDLYITLGVNHNIDKLNEASKIGKDELNRVAKELFKNYPKAYTGFEDK